MSGVTATGGRKTGKAAASTWVGYNRRPLPPFLQRNLDRALSHATMGFSFSSLKSSVQGPERVILESSDEEDEDPRPAKRRKIMDNNSKTRLAENAPIPTRVPNKLRQAQCGNRLNITAVASLESLYLRTIYLQLYFFKTKILSLTRRRLLIEPQVVRKDWLPLTANNFPRNSEFGRKITAGEITLSRIRQLICEFPLFESEWRPNSTRISVIYEKANVSTSASLKVDVLWSLPSHLSKTRKILTKPEVETQWGTETISEPSSVALLSPDEQLPMRSEPEIPDRGHRRRANVPTYNLKALSAKAQGKLPRAQRNRDAQFKTRGPSSDPDTLGVTYSFGKNDSSDYGIKQQHSVVGMTCPICNSDHKSVERLQFHLTTNHTQLKFHLRPSNPPRISFFVELNRPSKGASTRVIHDQSRILQLGKVTPLLDMEKYINGDQKWLKSRQGPQHEEWPEHLKYRCNEPSLSPSLESSRQSSPDEVDAFRSAERVPQLSNLPVRRRKRFYVPNTKTPLYDLITKRVLTAGEELPDSDDEKDEHWLFQKQRDLVNDFTDVTDDEKDYIIRWNDYILPLRLTADTHLPAALVRFVESNRIWFAERHSRKRELLKYIEGNVMLGSINEERHDAFLSACIQHLQKGEEEYAKVEREQEEARQNKDPSPPPLLKSQGSRGFGLCVCGDLVPPIESILCHDFVS
ncbi:Zinc finger domain-containing PHD-finger protein [Rutstroemia sp. NJR-2017a BBW]|nr:Zinc finger domain-containing PHD-finger protein [Rutstroemia sp. NJR-2017a BBW]